METPKQRLEKIYSWYNTNASDIERKHKELYPKSKFTKQTLYNIESELTKNKLETEDALMKITGHSTLKALQMYLRDIDAELPEDYSDLIK